MVPVRLEDELLKITVLPPKWQSCAFISISLGERMETGQGMGDYKLTFIVQNELVPAIFMGMGIHGRAF